MPTVFVIADDPSIREMLESVFQSERIRAQFFITPAEFLNILNAHSHGCLLLDLCSPNVSHEHLVSNGCTLPVIGISSVADVALAVRAMKAGALDVIQKPFAPNDLLRQIRRALERDKELWRERAERARLELLLSTLTARERQVMEYIVSGATTKQIAIRLGVSTQAIDAHRERILRKMQVSNVVELVKLLVTGRCPYPVSPLAKTN